MFERWRGARRLGCLAGIVLACWLVPAALPAAAHQTLLLGRDGTTRETALPISDADIAWAVRGVLPAGATQHLSFLRPASGRFRARALVSTFQANLRLNPWLALVGPGLPRPAALDGLLNEGEGAVLIAPPSDRELELFQDERFPMLAGATFELELPIDAGPYLLLIFDPTGESGPYIIDTGYLQD